MATHVVKAVVEFEPPIQEVQHLLLHPGEVLVVKLADSTPAAAAEDIRNRLAEVFGEEQKILVLAAGVELEVVQPVNEGGVVGGPVREVVGEAGPEQVRPLPPAVPNE